MPRRHLLRCLLALDRHLGLRLERLVRHLKHLELGLFLRELTRRRSIDIALRKGRGNGKKVTETERGGAGRA